MSREKVLGDQIDLLNPSYLLFSSPMRFWLFSTLASLLVLGSGCIGNRHISTSPETLRGINQQLEGRWATVHLASGDVVRARDVQIAPDSTAYFDRRAQEQRRLATSRVACVSLTVSRGTRPGLIIGAVPGLVVTASSVAQIVREGQQGFGAGLGIVLGVPLVLTGGIVGALVGAVVDDGKQHVVYRSPVDRYDAGSTQP